MCGSKPKAPKPAKMPDVVKRDVAAEEAAAAAAAAAKANEEAANARRAKSKMMATRGRTVRDTSAAMATSQGKKTLGG